KGGTRRSTTSGSTLRSAIVFSRACGRVARRGPSRPAPEKETGSRLLKGDGAPDVGRYAGEPEKPEPVRKSAAPDGEEHEQIGRVVEAEAVAELSPAGVLVEKAGNADQRHGRPQQAVQPRPHDRPDQEKEQRRGDEETQAVEIETERRLSRLAGEHG